MSCGRAKVQIMAGVPDNLRAMMLTPLLFPHYIAANLENLHRFLGFLGYRMKSVLQKSLPKSWFSAEGFRSGITFLLQNTLHYNSTK